MNEVLNNPMVGICGLAAVVIVACTFIVFVTEYLRKTQQASIDAYLKQEMLNRGMSAEEIKTVLEANSDGEATRMALAGSQGIRVGLGKFHVKVGEMRESASELSEAAASKC